MSRPELGKRMAEAIHRPKPFTGELIRQYENDKSIPRQDALRALSLVLGRTPKHLMYGDAATNEAREPTSPKYLSSGGPDGPRTIEAKEELLLDLFSGLFSFQQRELIDEMKALFRANQITRKEMGVTPLRGVSNAAIEAAFGKVPAPTERHPKKKAPHAPGRPPGAELDDYS